MQLKKLIHAAVLAMSLASANSFAAGMFDPYTGIALGNVCRTGIYYSFVGFAPVGSGCWNHYSGTPGMISTW